MNIVWQPVISRSMIEEAVSEEQIMEYYLGIPCKKGLFRNPLRTDRHKTAGFYRDKKGQLIFKDFAGYFYGNWITVVMTKFNCCYMTALRIVANDFNIVKDKNREQNKPLLKYTGSKIEERTTANIQVELKDYTDKELRWWASFGISRETLDKYDVYSIKNVFVNGDLTYLYKPNQLVFGYYGGRADDVELWKIYFPNKQNMRFMSNWNKNKLQGYDQLPKESGFIVCTKAMKDVMLLSEFEVPAVAPMSETVFMSESQYAKLKERYNKTFLLFDNDLPGISNANKIRKKFPDIQVLIIPRNSRSKDITDYYRDHGKEKTIQLIEQAKSFYL